MIKIWEFFVHGCWHRWRAMDSMRLVKNSTDQIGYGFRYIYQCEKCHQIKKRDLT